MFGLDPSYAIGFDPVRAQIRARLVGLWTQDMVDRYFADLGIAIAQQAKRTPAFGLLIDGREFAVQPAAVNERFRTVAAGLPPVGEGPLKAIAIVAGTMLNKLQARRTFEAYIAIFRDIDRAMDWIDAEIAGARPVVEPA